MHTAPSPAKRIFVDGNGIISRASRRQSVQTLLGHQGPVNGVTWSPDGNKIASCGADNTIRIWDVHSGRVQAVLEGNSSVYAVAWEPDGVRLASTSDRAIRIWDTVQGKYVHTIEGDFGFNLRLSWSPDGKLLAAGGKTTRPGLGHFNLEREAFMVKGC